MREGFSQVDRHAGDYFVSMVDGRRRVCLAVGPFANDHLRALELVDATTKDWPGDEPHLLMRDLLGAALSEVNWQEIAEAWEQDS